MSKQEEASKLDGTWGTSVGTDRSFLLKEKKWGSGKRLFSMMIFFRQAKKPLTMRHPDL